MDWSHEWVLVAMAAAAGAAGVVAARNAGDVSGGGADSSHDRPAAREVRVAVEVSGGG